MKHRSPATPLVTAEEGSLGAWGVASFTAPDKPARSLIGSAEKCRARTHDALPAVPAEETPLILVFRNLISNALKYRRRDVPPVIHVHADAGVKAWTVSVRDNGTGIDGAHFEEVFAPFKRFHGADYPGSGLGLAICQRVVERFGGRIWVESERGLGSTFRFTLPNEEN